jgi:hypothetical protein
MSTRDNIKRKSEVSKENKQPPVQEQNQNQENYKEITEEEKALYSGQDHIEESQNLENITEKVEVETPKQNIITRPRETYLQEKITKLENNTNLISNIKKELNGQVKNVMDDNVLITEIPADLNKFIKRNNVKNNLSVDFNEKLKYKQLKVLKEEKETLKKHLQKAEQNEKLLKDEGFLSLKIGGKEETMFDKGMKEHELKTVEKKIKNIKDKIQEADDKIYAIIQQIEPMTMKEKRKLYLENFEREREIAETRAKKYFREAKNRNLRIQNDINQLMERRKKEIELKDKEAEKERMEIVQKFREQEKAMEQKHSKKNIEIMLKYKPFLDKSLEKKSADYRYNQILEEYKDKEKKFLSKVKEKRHKLYNSDKYDEINEFQKKVDERKEKDDQRREIKRKEQLENWKSMKSSLPKCNFESVAEREQKRKEEEERRKQQAHALRVEKMNYGDNIRERRSPEINDGLKKNREKIIKTLENPKSAQVKYTLNKQKQNRIIIKKRDNTKPSKYKWKLKLEDSNSIEDEINNKLIKKPKKITTTYMATIPRTNSLATNKKHDYLRDIIAQKEEKKRNMSSENKNTEIDTVKDKEQKWEKTIKENKGTLMENISDVRDKITSLEKQAKMQEKLMRLNGGIGKNPKIGKKVSDLLIDSIEAKLSIINQINNN